MIIFLSQPVQRERVAVSIAGGSAEKVGLHCATRAYARRRSQSCPCECARRPRARRIRPPCRGAVAVVSATSPPLSAALNSFFDSNSREYGIPMAALAKASESEPQRHPVLARGDIVPGSAALPDPLRVRQWYRCVASPLASRCPTSGFCRRRGRKCRTPAVGVAAFLPDCATAYNVVSDSK